MPMTSKASIISENDGSKEQLHSDWCLICCIPCGTTVTVATSSSKNIWSPSSISSRLYVIFILRKLLELPNDILEKYLTCLGDPFDKWVTLCSNCSAIIDQAEKVYYELVKIQRKFDSIKKIIIDKVKNSEDETINGSNSDDVSGVSKRGRGRRRKVCPPSESPVTIATLNAESREFIKRNDYNLLFDPFMDGDLEAPTDFSKRSVTSPLKLPKVNGEVTYLYLPREEENENNDHSNLNLDDDDNGANIDSGDFGGPSSDIENDNNDEPASSLSPSKLNKTLDSQTPLETPESLGDDNDADEEESSLDWSVKLECPYCESYQFLLTKGETFCAHLEICHGLLGENKDKLLCCPICDEFTRTKDERIQFVEHLPICYGGSYEGQSKLNWKVLVCDACPGPVRNYFKLDGFIQHFQIHRKNLFRCGLCPTRFIYRKSQKSGRSHFEKSHPESLETFNEESCIIEDKTLPTLPWLCPLCPESVFNEESLRDSHVQSEHPDYKPPSESSLKCQSCSEVYYCPYDIRLHEGTEHNLRQFYCEICSKAFSSKQSRQSHQELKHRPKNEDVPKTPQFSCTLCTSSFYNRSNLRDHIRKTHGQKYETSYACKICGVCCQSNANLKRHLGQRHGIGDYDKHVCPYEGCGKVFWLKSCWKRHLTVHKGQPEFRCSFCYKGIYSKTGLQIHELQHINAETKPYQCQECGKRFAVMNNLHNHMKFHVKRPIEETRWTCPVCQKSFSSKKNGRRHLKSYCKGNKVD